MALNLKVLLWNIETSRLSYDSDIFSIENRIEGIKEEILREKYDIICLQEVRNYKTKADSTKEAPQVKDLLIEHLRGLPNGHVFSYCYEPGIEDTFHMTLFIADYLTVMDEKLYPNEQGQIQYEIPDEKGFQRPAPLMFMKDKKFGNVFLFIPFHASVDLKFKNKQLIALSNIRSSAIFHNMVTKLGLQLDTLPIFVGGDMNMFPDQQSKLNEIFIKSSWIKANLCNPQLDDFCRNMHHSDCETSHTNNVDDAVTFFPFKCDRNYERCMYEDSCVDAVYYSGTNVTVKNGCAIFPLSSLVKENSLELCYKFLNGTTQRNIKLIDILRKHSSPMFLSDHAMITFTVQINKESLQTFVKSRN